MRFWTAGADFLHQLILICNIFQSLVTDSQRNNSWNISCWRDWTTQSAGFITL